MRRSTLALAVVLGALAVDAAACNSISGVGDFSFAGASSTTGAGLGGSASSAGGTAGASSTSGGGGGGADAGPLEVACPKTTCVVTAKKACCYDNPTEHAKESGRCLTMPPPADGCLTDNEDGGKETRIQCSGPADCPGGSCCATYGGMDPDAGGSWYSYVTCKDKCGASDITLCDPTVKDACGLGTNASCSPSILLPSGYFVCP